MFILNANSNILLERCIGVTAFIWKEIEVGLGSVIPSIKNFNSCFLLGGRRQILLLILSEFERIN